VIFLDGREGSELLPRIYFFGARIQIVVKNLFLPLPFSYYLCATGILLIPSGRHQICVSTSSFEITKKTSLYYDLSLLET